MTEITPMRWWHIDDVCRIEALQFPGDPWTTEQFWQELGSATRRYLVALAGDEVVGYAGAFVLEPDADLQTIAVATGFQRRGIARRLLGALIDHVAANGASQMFLEVRAGNDGAIALYREFGFEQVSIRSSYYPDGGDAVIMRLRPVIAA